MKKTTADEWKEYSENFWQAYEKTNRLLMFLHIILLFNVCILIGLQIGKLI